MSFIVIYIDILTEECRQCKKKPPRAAHRLSTVVANTSTDPLLGLSAATLTMIRDSSSSGITVLGGPYLLPKLSTRSFRLVSSFRCFSTEHIFMVYRCHPHGPTPAWRTRVCLFVWVITFDLSGYATASIALRIIWPPKPSPLRQTRYTRAEGGGR